MSGFRTIEARGEPLRGFDITSQWEDLQFWILGFPIRTVRTGDPKTEKLDLS